MRDVLGYNSSHAYSIFLYVGLTGIIGTNDQEENLFNVMPINIAQPQHRPEIALEILLLSLEHAVSYGADVVNLSLGIADDPDLKNYIQDMTENADVLITVVAAAGNSSEALIQYPARYSNVIAVGMVDQWDQHVGSYMGGPEKPNGVDINGPGGVISTTFYYEENTFFDWYNDGFLEDPNGIIQATRFSKTSSAAPHVTGAVAVMLSVNPGLTPANIMQIIHETATRWEGMGPEFGSFGIIDMEACIQQAKNWSE